MITIVSEKNVGFALGASEYLVKPIDSKQLFSVLHKYHQQVIVDAGVDNGMRLLLVEDDAVMSKRLEKLLGSTGWTVETAKNGYEALQVLESSHPDLILLDLIMPEMDGFEFINKLKTTDEWQHIPIFVITAKDLTEKEYGFLNNQVENILQKSDSILHREEFLENVRKQVFSKINIKRNLSG